MTRLHVRPEFRVPLFTFALLMLGFVPQLSVLWLAGIALGTGMILRDSFEKTRAGTFSLDYIAFLAMVVSVISGEHLAGAVVALMITGGEALDAYASARAEGALRSLAERIPKTSIVHRPDGMLAEMPLQEITSGMIIIVKPHELIPLDGVLKSGSALLNEANLTGEAIPREVPRGAFVKSGCVNAGKTIELRVSGTFESSTYMRIVRLVDEAKQHQPRVVRLAEEANIPFTILTLALAGGAWIISGELARALAVLVIATPCPLLIAAPVAFIGGLSRAARKMVIVKRPATLEALSRVRTVFFDKTGTLTLGEPALTKIDVLGRFSERELVSIVAAIEFHSLHPLARACVAAREARGTPLLEATDVEETIGVGIEGSVADSRFRITKADAEGIALSIFEGTKEVGRFHFEDDIKENVASLFALLEAQGIRMEIITGDRKENAERQFGRFGIPIRAECSPEEKYAAIEAAKKSGAVAMVGDGLNDAPALAHADVGIVFSGTENSAAIDAAHAVILGRDPCLVAELFNTSARSMRIASQSIWSGIVLSSIGMGFAALGFIPPVLGAILQECIDVAVIINSLRASSGTATCRVTDPSSSKRASGTPRTRTPRAQ